MNPKTPTEIESCPAALSGSFTPREIAVLSRRFGIELEDTSSAELKSLAKLIPPRGGNGGQGGAPVHVVTEVSADSNDADKNEIPGIKMTRA